MSVLKSSGVHSYQQAPIRTCVAPPAAIKAPLVQYGMRFYRFIAGSIGGQRVDVAGREGRGSTDIGALNLPG